MLLLSSAKIGKINLEPQEKYFIDLWYSMTHMNSLDSYRVKCLNSRTIIREINEEIQIGLIKESEFKNICLEAKEFLSADPVITSYFQNFFRKLLPLLENPPSLQKQKDSKQKDSKLSGLRYLIGDFASSLERTYFDKLIAQLPNLIIKDKEMELKTIVDALLSDLIDRGWPLETLFSWHRKFLATKGKAYSFSENLSFMLKILSSEPQEHQVFLQLQGGSNLELIKNYGDFTFQQDVKIEKAKLQNNFGKAAQGVVFASTTINDVDQLSAAIRAREKFEQVIDLLRFDLEPHKLIIKSTCYVKRQSDGRDFFPTVQTSVPNPTERVGQDDFITFTKHLDSVSNKATIDDASKRQLQASVRQYRFGRDSENYNDKFLNWWMGLEALSRVDNGKEIGATVTYNVSRAMVIPYLHRLVRDLATTIKYCRITWPQEIIAISGCTHLDDLTVKQLLTILQSKEQQLLWENCAKFPTLSIRGKEIGEILSSASKTAERLNIHLQHLEKHLERLYRIRCCIVHGAPIRFRLGLLAANLEYYLKQLIIQILNVFQFNDHVRNLAEFFERAAIAYEETISELQDKNSGEAQIRSAVFLNFVLTEKDPIL